MAHSLKKVSLLDDGPSLAPEGSPINLSQLSRVDKRKKKLFDSEEECERVKKVSSPVGFSFLRNATPPQNLIPPSSLKDDDDDIVFADLKLHRRKMNVKKRKVLTEMQNELMMLLQSAKFGLAINSEEENWAEAADLSAPSPAQ
ncbi:hypothetical protein CJ030_MR0G010410 [Morella rubra]|uniref:Uncharacterized protein n=1 Tax=Morella rubra TaxID=262757 RepID=A0A6A1UH51_9ROSI|nr:hypothetical protein CJ030_MR0G010407 [Morella rubra]KAB1199886.1 hypothetical protein CJ030_MR0G010409 [Morella rubra]KAB1199887.1 hypothetical protein CJ030_MR0G010410 [Morella rubra]